MLVIESDKNVVTLQFLAFLASMQMLSESRSGSSWTDNPFLAQFVEVAMESFTPIPALVAGESCRWFVACTYFDSGEGFLIEKNTQNLHRCNCTVIHPLSQLFPY